MKKLFSALLTVALMILVISTAFASEIRPFADDFFREATVSLNNEMQASFKATTSSDVEELKVISCVLQKKSRALWIKDTDLVAPSTIANNTKYYALQAL